VAIGDLDGDGKPDLAIANEASNSVSVLRGLGGGSFAAKTDYGAGSHPRSVAIGDLNADGRPELVVANHFSSTLSVLLNLLAPLEVDPPSRFARLDLAPPRPNPFSTAVTLDFAVSSSALVRLELFDLAGRRVKIVQDGILPSGRHVRTWDGLMPDGSAAPTGLYVVRFSTPGLVRTTKALLVR
jgi:hypothetical protein